MINAMDKVDKWHLDRHSNFTSSENWKLLGVGKDGTGFSQTGLTYIMQKAVDTMTVLSERPELENVKSFLHGKMYEEPAFNRYVSDTKNYNMRYFGSENPVYLKFNDHSGGSPDSLMGQADVIHLVGEIKCPKNSNIHFENLEFKTQWDLKEKRLPLYTQVQDLMRITGALLGHSISYDERFKNRKLQIKIIEILPDKKFQDNLEVRIYNAQKEKLKIIERLQNLN